MKKIQYTGIATVFLCLALTIACENGLTDETFSVYDENTLTKPEHAEQAVRGTYAALKDNGGFGYYAGHLYWLYEYQADVVTTTGTARQGGQIDQLTYDASNATFNSVWISMYRLISRANESEELISRIDFPGNSSTEELKNQYLGEVRFLRALAYYDATSLWGDVPLFLKSSAHYTEADENPVFAPQEQVEQAMIADLTFAETHLPASFPPAQVARATRGAAKALLTRLYMRRGNWQLAADKAAEVIGTQYDLRTRAEGGIKSLFSTENRSDNEFIFVLKSSSEPGAYGINSNSFGINSVPWDYNRGWNNFPLHLNFYKNFTPEDDRRTLLTGIYKALNGTVISVPKIYGGLGGAAPDTVAATFLYNLKYPHVNNYNYAGFNNVTILRYADVLLMRAEALNELNGPTQESIALLNEIRVRAGLAPKSLSDFASKETLRDELFDERNREFFMEGRRRDDLIRWGRSATNGADHLAKFREKVMPTLLGPTYSESVDYARYPYPQNEIQSNTSIDAGINAGRVRQ